MLCAGIKYSEGGVNGKIFASVPCVAQMIPRGKSQAMKLVMPKGGGPFHDRCLKEEGSGVIDKTKWDDRFMSTWSLKTATKRSIVQRSRMNRQQHADGVGEDGNNNVQSDNRKGQGGLNCQFIDEETLCLTSSPFISTIKRNHTRIVYCGSCRCDAGYCGRRATTWRSACACPSN